MRLEKDNVPLHHWQSTVQCFIYITIFFIFDFSVQPCQSIVPVAMNIVFFFSSVVVVFFFSSGTTSHKWLQFSLQFFFSLPLLLGTHWFWSWPICCCLFAAASVELLSNKFTFNIFLVYSRTKKKNNRNWLRYMALCSTVFWPLAIYSLLCCVFSYGHSAKRIRSGHMDMKYNNK